MPLFYAACTSRATFINYNQAAIIFKIYFNLLEKLVKTQAQAFHLSKAVWPYMKKQKFGRIINIVSAHGLFATEYKSAYVAAKHGIVGLLKQQH